MCGIVGYVGPREAAPILLEGLARLEYRGYDSAGLSVLNGHGIETCKLAGRVAALGEAVARAPLRGACGIAHTRWATHGAPTERNAHPHGDCAGTLALVHNGIIENADVLRGYLARAGHKLVTDTDTETLVHLIEEAPGDTLEERVRSALHHVVGTYGVAVLSASEPGKIVAARRGSPVLLGVGEGELFVASDASAVVAHTRSVVYLEDGDIAVLTRDGYRVLDEHARERQPQVDAVDWEVGELELDGFAHFMLQEIHEQPTSVRNTLRGRLLRREGDARLNGLNLQPNQCERIRRIVILACGTSWHAGLVGRHVIDELAGIPGRGGGRAARRRARWAAGPGGGGAGGGGGGAGPRRPWRGQAPRAVPGTRRQLPGGARGCLEAQGDQLRPRGRIPGGGNEARPHRADRREHAGRVRGPARPGVLEGGLQHAGSEGAGRADHRGHDAGKR